jgi:hypothetical protein
MSPPVEGLESKATKNQRWNTWQSKALLLTYCTTVKMEVIRFSEINWPLTDCRELHPRRFQCRFLRVKFQFRWKEWARKDTNSLKLNIKTRSQQILVRVFMSWPSSLHVSALISGNLQVMSYNTVYLKVSYYINILYYTIHYMFRPLSVTIFRLYRIIQYI